jgi:hypothetical protein
MDKFFSFLFILAFYKYDFYKIIFLIVLFYGKIFERASPVLN